MARLEQIDAAKRRLLRALESKPWLVSLGTGKVEGEAGVVVSVDKGSREAAVKAIRGHRVAVPVRIREVGSIRLRAARARTPAAQAAALRREAERRSEG